MKTFKQSGEVLPVIAPYDVQRGSGVLIGQLFGLACATVNAGTSVDIMCKGEFVVDKVTTEAWAVGDKIYWNSSSKKFSNVGGGGLLVGLASESAVNPSFLGSLLLTQQPGLVDPVFNAVTGGIKYFIGADVPIVYSFPDFSPSIVASLVSGSTAAQTGNTVTITAAAHGAVGNNSRDGYRIYYPGSPTITAGWYPDFRWVDANTLRFTNPASQTVASESVNGGVAYIALTTVCSATIPGGSIGANGECSLGFIRSSDTLGFSKLLYQFYSGLSMSAASISTAGAGLNGAIGFRNIASEAKQLGIFSSNGTAGAFAPSRAVDSTSDQPLSALVQLPNAGLWISIDQLDYRITRHA